MSTETRNFLVAAGAVALIQTAVLGWMVFDRIQLLRHGREIVLPIVPVDPRSLFRGDYVILSYPISRVPAKVAGEVGPLKPRDTVHVTLEQGADGAWAPVALSRARPARPLPQNRIALAARPRWQWGGGPGAAIDLRYGIESYFVPEGRGKALERLVGEKKLAAVIAVDGRGNAAIKGLSIDGKLQYEEPLL